MYHTVNFYHCTVLPIICTVIKNHACNIFKYWSYNRNLRVCTSLQFLSNFTCTALHITTFWGCWKHSFWIPGARPMFLKPNLHKKSKNGFKTISCRPYPVMIFSKNCFWCKKSSKKIGHSDDFLTFMAMYMIKLHQF